MSFSECQIDCRFGVQTGCIKQGYTYIIRPNKQRQFGATRDNPFSTSCRQPIDNSHNGTINGSPLLCGWYQHIGAETPLESA